MELMTTDEICKYLNLKKSRIRYLCFKNMIPFVKINTSVRFDRKDIDKWLKSMKQEVEK